MMTFAGVALIVATSFAAKPQPVIDYTIRISVADTTGFDVEMRIESAPDTFRLAMGTHPEYNDRFWRYVENPTVIGKKLGATITREDSAVWKVISRSPSIVRYRIHLPPRQAAARSAWVPFVSPTGALVGDMHSFMYIVGAEQSPSRVTVLVPDSWNIATALERTSAPKVFYAPNADVLMDSPILTGNLREWDFTVHRARHRVFYWPLPNATPFDTLQFVNGVRGLAEQGIALFHGAPYHEYTFLFQDGAFGALEHKNSVTLGAPSSELARDRNDLLAETAHEYFHLWDAMRIRPIERGGLDYRPSRESRGLWFTEGLSLFYSDLLLRRAGVATEDTTRAQHLARLIARYLGNTAYTHISPETSSLAAYRATPGTLGDYSPSVHLQGEIVGAMLDIIIRDATNGAKSIDDVMREMNSQFGHGRGFSTRDVEKVVTDVCKCSVTSFFDAHIRDAKPIDFDQYLGLIAMRTRVRWAPARKSDGQLQPDLRIFGYMVPGETRPRLLVSDPNSVWARSGVHSQDQLVSLNGHAMSSWPDLRNVLRSANIGDTLRFEVLRNGQPISATVVVTSYDQPTVTLEEIPTATLKRRRLRAAWLASH